MGSEKTLNFDQGLLRSCHERSDNNHADRQSLCGNGKNEILCLLATLVLGSGVNHSKNEAVHVHEARQAGKVVDHLATSLTSVQAHDIRVRVWDI